MVSGCRRADGSVDGQRLGVFLDLSGHLTQCDMGAHDPGDGIFIGNRKGRHPHQGGKMRIFLGMRAAGQEAEV